MSESDQILQKKDEEAQHNVNAKTGSKSIIWGFSLVALLDECITQIVFMLLAAGFKFNPWPIIIVLVLVKFARLLIFMPFLYSFIYYFIMQCFKRKELMKQVIYSRNIKRCKGFMLYRYDNIFNSETTKKEIENLKKVLN